MNHPGHAIRGRRWSSAAVALLLVALDATGVGAVAPERLIARAIERDGVTVPFPAVTYQPPSDGAGPVAVVCARAAAAALGTTVDPVRDLLAETIHRVVLRDPTDPKGQLLKMYRPDHYSPDRIAKLIQRDLGLEDFLRGLGLRLAAIDRTPRLLERGVLRQQRIDGTSLADLYPNGYARGDNPAVDRMLARIAPVDRPLLGIVSRQSGYLMSNTVDCKNDTPLGVDVGHCLGNIFLERGSGDPVLIDW